MSASSFSSPTIIIIVTLCVYEIQVQNLLAYKNCKHFCWIFLLAIDPLKFSAKINTFQRCFFPWIYCKFFLHGVLASRVVHFMCVYIERWLYLCARKCAGGEMNFSMKNVGCMPEEKLLEGKIRFSLLTPPHFSLSWYNYFT